MNFLNFLIKQYYFFLVMVFQLNQFQAGAQDGNGNDMEMQYSGMDDNHDGG